MKPRRPATPQADTYEILVILFGALGLNRLYLGQPGLALARFEVALTALVAFGTGVLALSVPFLVIGTAFSFVALALWVHDWLTVDLQVVQVRAADTPRARSSHNRRSAPRS